MTSKNPDRIVWITVGRTNGGTVPRYHLRRGCTSNGIGHVPTMQRYVLELGAKLCQHCALDERRTLIKRMDVAGLTTAQIARRLPLHGYDVCEETVRRDLRMMGRPPSARWRRRADDGEAAGDLATGPGASGDDEDRALVYGA